MKIALAQTKPQRGDILHNIENHKKLINLAISNQAKWIIFPELSLTGYEPSMAKELATLSNDSRLETFQKLSDLKRITIGVGLPTYTPQGICISLLLFQPDTTVQLYSKKHLHPDELPFFISGENLPVIVNDSINTALAICYEISIPEHSENAFKSGAGVYIASVAKTQAGVEKAHEQLSAIAAKYGILVMMSNCIGASEDGECAGQSSFWNTKGKLVDSLDNQQEGLLIADTDTLEVLQIL